MNPDTNKTEGLSDQKPSPAPSKSREIEKRIEELVNSGYSESRARLMVESLFETKKEEILQPVIPIKPTANEQLYSVVATMAALVVALLSAVTHSPVGYPLAIILGGIGGYYDNPHKALAGIIGTVSGIIVFFIAFHYYFLHRSTILRLEVVIPAIPGAIVGYMLRNFIASVFYSHQEE